MFKTIKIFILTTIIINIISGCDVQQKIAEKNPPTQKTSWQTLAEGLSYKEIHINPNANPKDLLLIKIDPKEYTFSIYENKAQEEAKTIEEIHKEQGSLLTFNGQFFTEDFKPTGLLISDGKELRKHSNANLMNGILAIDEEGNIKFFDTSQDVNEKKYTFAIQNGPVLINKKEEIAIKEDSGKTASRTAIGVDKEENLILIIVKQSLLNFDNSISLYQLAQLLKTDPQLQEFQFKFVLNLDGGTSVGLMMDDKYYPEMEKVQNVVLVKKR
jgi:exopolysaccharide biosynthesis protein